MLHKKSHPKVAFCSFNLGVLMREPDQSTQDAIAFIGIVGPVILFIACVIGLVLVLI